MATILAATSLRRPHGWGRILGAVEGTKIVRCTAEHLIALEVAMPSQHRTRFGVQLAGEGVFFIALLGDVPVGHVLLRWRPIDETLVRLGISDPNVEALGVLPAHRSRGIGTELMRSAEHAARERGCLTIGLEVGTENARARAMYRRLGYVEAGLPPFEVTWAYRDGSGVERVEGEICTHFTKRLAP